MLLLDFDQRCRLCLQKAESMIPLFIENGRSGFNLCDRIEKCTSLKLVECDGLPRTMCIDCLSKLDLIKEFQEQCQQSEAALQEHLQAFLTEKEQKENSKYNDSDAEVAKLDILSQKNLPTNQIETNASETGAEFSRQLQELSFPIKQEESVCKPNKSHSGKRQSKRILANQENSKQFVNNDNQEDDEYRWPGSLSDEEFERHKGLDDSKTQDSNLPDATGNQKKKPKVYECEFCERTFSRSNHLVQHELTHTKDEPFHCDYCNKGFWYKNSLIGHIKQNHTGDVNFTCEECGRGFFQRSEFMRHLPTHSDETPFKCEECGMTFKLLKNLKRHQKVHSGTRTHTCQYCGKSFRIMQTLRVHLITHTGEKPFKCTHCGKGFSQSAPLKAHIRALHTGEKPYCCDMCGEGFPTGNTLKAHIFKHTGIHPNSCNACSLVFRRKRDLISHRDAVHGGFVTSPLKVPPQLPLHEVLIDNPPDTPGATSTTPDICPPSVHIHDALSPTPAESHMKLEPTTPQHIDVDQHIMMNDDDSLSDDSMSVNTLPPLPLPMLQQHSPISATLMMSPSSDELLATDLTFS